MSLSDIMRSGGPNPWRGRNPFLDHNRPSFYAIYSEEESATILKISDDWVASYGSYIPDECCLVSAPGKKWDVTLLKTPVGWFFKDKWLAFASENYFEDSDMLTFVYVGRGVFLVKQYKLNACPPQFDLDSISLDWSTNSDVEVEDTMEADTAMSSRNPSSPPNITIKLLHSHIKNYLNFPLSFWRENIGTKEMEYKAVFEVDNQSWDVKIIDSGDRVTVLRCWTKFKQDHGLALRTLLRFDLTEVEGPRFDVHITV